MAQVRRGFLFVLVVGVVTLGMALDADAQSRYTLRGLIGAAPSGCSGESQATLAGISAGFRTPYTEISAGGITNGCGEQAGQLWPTVAFAVGPSMNIRGHAAYFRGVVNVDFDVYTLKRELSSDGEGDKFAYFRPGFMAGVAITGWGQRTHADGSTGRAHLLYLGGEVGGFSGNGAYALFAVAIQSSVR